MWVFTNSAFVSVVQDRDDPKYVWVRGRVKGDVERFLRDAGDVKHEVATTPDGDYLYRAKVLRADVAEALLRNLEGVAYDNFKGSIPTTKAGDARHTFYMRVWSAMTAYQKQLVPKSHYYRGGR